MEALGHIGMNLDGSDRLVVEWLEGASLEEIGHIDDAQGFLRSGLSVPNSSMACL